MSRTLAIGDIHGCLTALNALIEAVAPSSEDTLITLGDYVDRGPDSFGVMEWVIRQRAENGLIALLGNHEIMMFDARKELKSRNRWFQHGGMETHESYVRANGSGGWDAYPPSHWQLLESLGGWHETATHIFVHAGLDPDAELEAQSEDALFWNKFDPDNQEPHKSGKTVVCGHTIIPNRRPLSIGHTIGIDTGVYHRDGWLTCLDAESGHYWQANGQGETREGDL